MDYRSPIKVGLGLTLLALIALGSAGCYTMLRHPQVAEEELVGQHESEMTGTSCTDCHNNEYDHHRSSSHSWGFGSWGIRTSPYGYYGYTGWQRYYYDPWWWGYGYGGYYDPWPYYNPGGGYGSGSGSGSSPSPDRPNSRRGLQQAPMGQSPPSPPPPAYISPAPSSPTQGGSSGQNQQGSNQGDNDNNKREGRRGGGK